MKVEVRNQFFAPVALMLLAATLGGTVGIAAVQADDGNPYSEGTTPVKLTPAEKAELLQYADNSKSRLDQAMQDAQGKGFREANSIYLAAIKAVVVSSRQRSPRAELLMRVTLNQALELTFGIPTADGRGTQSPGVLAGISNTDLLTVILEDSIKLAQNYYQDDRTAIQKGTLADLPYMDQAVQELALSRKWLAAVTEPGSIYQLSVVALQHFMNSAANEDQMHRAIFAEEMTRVSDLLDQNSMQIPSDPQKLMSQIRVLRGELRRLQESAARKLQSSGIGSGIPSTGGAGAGGTNTIGMKFVSIRPGTFLMGSPTSESGRDNDEAQHQVTLTRSFEIQVTDVTQAQWVQVMGKNPSYFQSKDNCPQNYVAKPIAMCPNHPVEKVSWNDVQDFIKTLNQTRTDGYTYRLPTEAEWEFAARAGTRSAYSYGDGTGQLSQYGWYSDNSGSQTHDVALLKPNTFGLYDMHGNVYQWVQDWYDSSLTRAQTDPVGPAAGSYRVLRGGGWSILAQGLRSANRGYNDPSGSSTYVGFRLVRTR